MNSKSQNKLAMYKEVMAVCRNNAAQMAMVAALQGIFEQFCGMISLIGSTMLRQVTDTRGTTKQKHKAKEKLVYLCILVASAVRSFANSTGDLRLANMCNYTPSSLSVMRNEELLKAAAIISNCGTGHLSDLEPFGVDNLIIDRLNVALADYTSLAPTVVSERHKRKVATSEIEEFFSRTDLFLREVLDPAMRIFGEKDPGFYHLYSSARKIHGNPCSKEDEENTVPGDNGQQAD